MDTKLKFPDVGYTPSTMVNKQVKNGQTIAGQNPPMSALPQ
jgi:hypothetical protein